MSTDDNLRVQFHVITHTLAYTFTHQQHTTQRLLTASIFFVVVVVVVVVVIARRSSPFVSYPG